MKTTNKFPSFLCYALLFAFILSSNSAFAQPATVTAAIGSPANGAQHHITLTWAAVGGATSYELEYSANGTNWTNIYTGTALTYDHNTGALGNVPAYYRVRSVSGTPSAYTNATQYPIYTAADAPAVPLLANATSSSMSLTLVPESPDPNSATTTYSIFCTTTSQYVQANGALGAIEVFQSMAAWGTITITGLTASTNYCFYAKAQNDDGDVRTASGSPITTVETFTTNANFATGASTTTKFYSPASCTTGGLTYSATGGCPDGYVGKTGSFNNYFGCYLRTPEQNCTGLTSVVINFDLSNSYFANHVQPSPSSSDAIRFYVWDNNFSSGNHYYRATSVKIGGVEKGVTDLNGMWLKFDELRNCVNVDVTFDFAAAGVPNVDKLLFYIEPNCSFNNSNVFSVKIDNVGVMSAAASTACLSTTACSAAAVQLHPANQIVCVNGDATFNVTATGSVASYQWQESVNGTTWNNIPGGGNYSGETTATLTISGVSAIVNGYQYRVIVTGTCGGNPTSNTATLTVNSAAGAAGSITGAASVCQGQTGVTYSVSAANGATSYAWSLPAGASITAGDGTNSITVTYSSTATAGDVVVTPSNTCGTGNASPAFAVTVNQLPAAPGTISGSTSVCGSSSETYSVAAVAGATSYTWTLPGGWTGSSTTETINATSNGSGGTISVTANNTCGSSAAQSLSVTVTGTPATPGIINGPDSICGGSPLTLSVAAAGGIDSYNWTLPIGWTGSSTTNTITISVGNSGGTVSVTAENSCGTSAAQTKTFTVHPTAAIVFNLDTSVVCYNARAFELNEGTPAGGVYSGNGVANGFFDPKAVANGNHVLTYDYTDVNGCGGSDTAVITVDACSGIEDVFAAGISIYPNPFQQAFVIQSAEIPLKTVIVYDAIGKEVLRRERVNALQTKIELPVSIAKGTYTLSIISKDDAVIERKMLRVE